MAREVPKARPRFPRENYCFDRHDKATHKAGLNLEISSVRSGSQKDRIVSGERCFDRLRPQGSMPSEKADQPASEEKANFKKLARKEELTAASRTHRRNKGAPRSPSRPGRIRKHSARYSFTSKLNSKEFFPKTTLSDGFDKVAEGLSFSPVSFRRHAGGCQRKSSP